MGIAEQLQKIDLFKEVSLTDLEALVARMEVQTFARGEEVFRENDQGDKMYIIRHGRIRIFMKDPSGTEITLTHYSDNQIFGELSPLDNKKRSASAAAADDLEVLVLDRDHFIEFLHERPTTGLAMMRSLSQRLRNTTAYLEENKPSRLKAPPQTETSSQEISRKAATPFLANLLDEVNSPDTHELSPSETPLKRAGGMGIFDRIAALDEERRTHKEEDDK